jgi:YVTN family beta-propeller protein
MIAVNPNTGNVYVINVVSNTVSVISPSNQVITTIPVGMRPQDVAVNPDSGNVYVANIESSTVSVISGSTNQVIATIHVGFVPQYLAVNPNTGNVYVNNAQSNTVSVISPSNQVIATIPVGRDPERVAVNPDSGNVYVVNNGGPDYNVNPSTISVISPSNQVITTIPVGIAKHGIAVNANTGNVYVTNEGSNTVSVISSTATVPIPPYVTITLADVDGFRIQDGDTTLSTFIRFTFTATPGINPVAGFECSLDNNAFSSCSSPTIPTNIASGIHTFKVRAIDVLHNIGSSPASFSWTILTPAQGIQAVINLINSQNIPTGVKDSLTGPLKQSIFLLMDNNPNNDVAVCHRLDAFLSQVDSYATWSRISQSLADELTSQAQAIETAIQC